MGPVDRLHLWIRTGRAENRLISLADSLGARTVDRTTTHARSTVDTMSDKPSAAPQARKLGLKAGHRVDLDEAPPGWGITDPPDGLIRVGGSEPADVIVAFFTAADQLPPRLPALGQRIFPAGALWAAWPRRAGGHRSDITDNVVRDHALTLGLVDVKVAAIDGDWSGLRLVWRVANRGGPAPHPSRGTAP